MNFDSNPSYHFPIYFPEFPGSFFTENNHSLSHIPNPSKFLDEFLQNNAFPPMLLTHFVRPFGQAMELLPQHVFIDDGDEETLRSAFETYRFCASAKGSWATKNGDLMEINGDFIGFTIGIYEILWLGSGWVMELSLEDCQDISSAWQRFLRHLDTAERQNRGRLGFFPGFPVLN